MFTLYILFSEKVIDLAYHVYSQYKQLCYDNLQLMQPGGK